MSGDRPWGPTGAVSAQGFALDDNARAELEGYVRSELLRGDSPEAKERSRSAFLDSLEEAIGNYRDFRRLYEESPKPGDIRKELRQARDEAVALQARIRQMSGASRMLLDGAEDPGPEPLEGGMEAIVSHLQGAYERAQEFQRRGRLPDHARLYLAADTAEAMRRYLLAKPSSSPSNPFLGVLTAVLLAATGERQKEVEHLAARALKVRRVEHESGLVEYSDSPFRSK